MQLRSNTQTLAACTSGAATIAVLAKTFVPFYLVGSSVIFLAFVSIGLIFAALNFRQIAADANRIGDVLILLGLFYGVVIINYWAKSFPEVSPTHLLGILIFHSLFLLSAAAIYLAIILLYVLRYGDPMRGGYLNDLFGVGDEAVFTTFHQNIGLILGLGALAALGLGSSRLTKFLAIGALPFVLILMFHIAARTALVALICSLIFLTGVNLWCRSKKSALLGALVLTLTVTAGSYLFYQQTLTGKNAGAKAPDAVSRTIREIQNPHDGLRIPIWGQIFHRIALNPAQFITGRGIGMYPIDEGFGAADWLLHPTEGSKHYPHNEYLELFYETGIFGLVLFAILTLFPIAASMKRWLSFSVADKSVMAIYLYILVSSNISGSFAYFYILQFFLALILGVISFKRSAEAPWFERAFLPQYPK
jgi:O-antigen ligase